jgi:hypothetical protein
MQTQSIAIVYDAEAALYAHTVDKLAQIKAQIAELREQENELKQLLIDSGKAAVDGTHHRATISDCAGKEIVDWQSIAMRFNPSRQLIRANTKAGESYFQIRVYSRRTS